WLGVQSDIPGLLRRHDALIHPSWYEGLPNAVCEALATGLPVLASAICDHPILVKDGERGMLFDPASPAAIAAAIARFAALNVDDRRRYARNARAFAVENLDAEQMITRYEQLLARLTGKDPA